MGFQRTSSAPSDAAHTACSRQGLGAPSSSIAREETRPDVILRLEALDDVIFAAIDGDPAALQESAQAWQLAVAELGYDAVEETRRQYLRHAQGVWDSLRHQDVPPPHKIFAAIEIIGLLVNSEQ